jgi:hypothetical protein
MKDEKEKKLKLEELHDTNQIVKPMLHEGHEMKSRRDFLAQGFLGMTAFALAPSALSLISSSAHAQATGCAAPGITGMTPVIIIDLAGGGNIAGSNVMVGGAGGQLDFLLPANYASLGLPPDFAPSLPGKVNSEMGLAFHSDSGMLKGIQSVAAVQTRSNVEGTIFCTTSDDDTGNNQSNPMYWLNKAGAKGQIQQLAGTQQSDSGGNSASPVESINPSIQPVRVQSNQDAVNLVSLGNRFAGYSPSQIDMILGTAGNMSGTKIGKIDRRSLPDKIKELLACGYSGTPDQIKKFSLVNVEPNQDAVATAVFNQITNQGIRDRAKPIAKLVIDGYIGAGTITLGGYDYHDGSRASGDARDFELGQLIGAIMELAARKQKDVVVYVLTDGGVSANNTVDNSTGGGGKFGWAGDSGQRSSTFMMVYKSGGKPSIRNQKRQIGYFKSNGAVEGAALLTSNSVVNTSKAMVANYLALHGKEGDLESIIGDDPFKTSLDKYLVFDKLR